MIGYYVHHVGRGHLHRAVSVAAAIGGPVTGLSSLPRPEGWSGDWIVLPRDDEDRSPTDPTAGGTLHWAPLQDAGLRDRMGAISTWIRERRPAVLVVDLSVEVALLARLHGVSVVSVVLPGDRSDGAHRLAHAASSSLVAVWPESAWAMVSGMSEHDRARLRCVGGLSRFPMATPLPRRPGRRRVVVLGGAGGALDVPVSWDALRAQSPGWEWIVLGHGEGTWLADPSHLLADADVVVTHAGQNAVAEVAAARRPAVVVPADRPHDEQRTTAAVLRGSSWPALVERRFPADGWAERLERVAAYDGSAWARWVDGAAAERFAQVVLGEVVGTDLQQQYA